MMNKKGSLVLRDMVFMMMIVSAIFVLSGLYVSEMAFNYENDDMANEWGLTGTNTLANSTFYSVGDNVTTTGAGLSTNSTGIWSLIEGAGNTLSGIGKALFMVLTAPNTVGSLVSATLEDMGVASGVASIIKYLIVIILWGIIIFTISSAFLRGGKL
jgi:hypothetical protein